MTVSNGRATLRDVMSLQREIYQEMTEIKDDLASIKTKVYVNAALITLVISVAMNVGIFLIMR